MINSNRKALISITTSSLIGVLIILGGSFSSASFGSYPEKQPERTYYLLSWVNDIDITPDGRYFAAITPSNLLWYSTASNVPVWTTLVGGDYVVISKDGNYILTGGLNYVALYKTNRNNGPENHPINWWAITTGNVSSIDISDNGEYFVIGDYHGNIYFFNRTAESYVGENAPRWRYDANSSITKVSISGDGNYVAAGTSWDYPALYLFSKNSNKYLKRKFKRY